MVCAATAVFLHPRPAHGFARRVFRWRPGDTPFDPANERASLLPNVTFWAWERPEDLRFLLPDQAGVAFLAKTISIETVPANSSADSSPSFAVRPRLQPLRITPGTQLIAVVRIETPSAPHASFSFQQTQSVAHSFPIFSDAQRALLASEIADLQSTPGVSAIQIDFDAPASAHAFYASLLQDVRRKLPPSMPLSITALASWCIGDPWLSQLPPGTIDEAVPMLFRMGPDAANVAKFLHSNSDFPVAACRGSLGLSTDEPLSHDLLTAKSSSVNLRPARKAHLHFRSARLDPIRRPKHYSGVATMISRIARIFAAIFLALLLILPPPLAFACGPDFTAPTYTDFNAPDARDSSYVHGKLGLLQRGYYHVYLFEAYRNLTGKPFNAAELVSLGFQSNSSTQQNASPSQNPAEPKNWIATWESTRANLLGEKPKNSPRTFDPIGVTRESMRDERFVFYYNCLSGAFENAVHTLQSRAAQFGAQSAVIKDWIAAQDQVFENCSADTGYPPKPKPAVIPAASHPGRSRHHSR